MKSSVTKAYPYVATQPSLHPLIFDNHAACWKVALPAGKQLGFVRSSDGYLVHVITGGIKSSSELIMSADLLSAGAVGTYVPGHLTLQSLESSKVIVVRRHMHTVSFDWPSMIWSDIGNVPISLRPGNIKVRSVWAESGMPRGIGYEYFRIGKPDPGMTEPEIVEAPPHVHENSDSIVFVLRCKGEVFLESKWKAIQAGDVITIPAGMVHAFCGNFAATSYQHREIGNDYVFPQA